MHSSVIYLLFAPVLAAGTWLMLFRPSRRWRHYLVLVALAGLLAILCFRLADIWCSAYEVNGSIFANAARLIDRFGWQQTHGRIYFGGGSAFNDAWPGYNHHPPGIAWIVALLYNFGGKGEAVARAVPIAFTLLGFAVFLWRLNLTRTNIFMGAFVVAAVSCPALTYYGRMLNFEPICLALGLATITLADIRPHDRRLTVLLVAIQLGLPWMGWCGLPLALAGSLLIARRIGGRWAYGLVILPLASSAAVVWHLANYGGGIREMWNASLGWTYAGARPAQETASFWLLFIKYRLGRTIPFMLIALLLLLTSRRLRCKLEPWLLRIVWIFLGMTILGIVLMPRAVMVHDYHWLWLWPPLALLAGVAADELGTPLRSRVIFAIYLAMVAISGMRGVALLHKPDTVFLVPEWRAGLIVRKLIPTDAPVAVVPAYAGMPYTFLYYADRPMLKATPSMIVGQGVKAGCLVIFDRIRNREPGHADLAAGGWSIVPSPRNASYAVYVRRR